MSLPPIRLLACAVILLVTLSSFLFLTPYGAIASILAGLAVICAILSAWPYVGVLTAAATIAGFIGAMTDNATNPLANEVLHLTFEAHHNPVQYDLSLDDQALAFEVIQACASHNVAQLQNATREAWLAAYERRETSWFSWAIKPTNVPGQCLPTARRLAEQSPAYAAGLRSIVADDSQL